MCLLFRKFVQGIEKPMRSRELFRFQHRNFMTLLPKKKNCNFSNNKNPNVRLQSLQR